MATLTTCNWSGCGGVPEVLAGQAGEGVEHGDAVFGGGGGVGTDGGEVSLSCLIDSGPWPQGRIWGEWEGV